MIRRKNQTAFTLIEMLIATTLIVLIVSVAYGTWITTAPTASRLKSSIAAAPIHRTILTQISRQLRGCYVEASNDELKNKTNTNQKIKRTTPKKTVVFLAKNNSTDGIICQYLTTTGFFYGKDETLNLLAVRYRYESVQQQLLYQQQPYFNNDKRTWPDTWHTVANQITEVSIQCFDGKTWKDHWDYNKEKQLPHAVKLTYTATDKTDHQETYTALATLNVQHDEK